MLNPQGDPRAACASSPPGMFYPTDTAGWKRAKRVCDRCEIKDECLQWALARNEHFGVWGGTSERTRRSLRQQRAAGRRRSAPGAKRPGQDAF